MYQRNILVGNKENTKIFMSLKSVSTIFLPNIESCQPGPKFTKPFSYEISTAHKTKVRTN